MKTILLLLAQNFREFVGKDVDPRPAYGGESAGMDFYNAGPEVVIPPLMPGDLHDWIEDLSANARNTLTWEDVPKHLRKSNYKILIPTGVKVALPSNNAGLIRGRGQSLKTPLISRAGVIDAGYEGEIFLNVVNLSSVPFSIGAGAKTPFQMVAVECNNNYHLTQPVAFEQAHSKSKRKYGHIGSSN